MSDLPGDGPYSGQRCEDCVHCEADDCDDIAYCLADPAPHPCPHDRVLCGNHNLEHCIDCRREAFASMAASGDYDPEGDPFYRPERKADDDAYAESGPRRVPGSPGSFYYPKDES